MFLIKTKPIFLVVLLECPRKPGPPPLKKKQPVTLNGLAGLIMYVNISLHDVTPKFQNELEHLLKIIRQSGSAQGTLLVIPDYHGNGPLTPQSPFTQWLRTLSDDGWEIVLHGYNHCEARTRFTHANKLSPARFVVSRLYTRGEGEFYQLTAAEARERISRGLSILKECGLAPKGFIAPAWLLSQESRSVLNEFNFLFTTTLTGIIELKSGTVHPVPAVSFSSRSYFRSLLSRMMVPAIARYSLRHDLVRLVLHPPDARNPAIIELVERLIHQWLYTRRQVTISEYLREKSRDAGWLSENL